MKKEIKNWLDSAKYDMETAEHMFNSGRYIYTIFMCQLALEKALKAKVMEITDKIPPKTHNLRYLLKLAKLQPDEKTFEFISKLSDVSIVTRYPEDFEELQKAYNKVAAQRYLEGAKEVFKWIQQLLT
ncbi:MAG: HEPN domain-containing protein [Chloroflexi bacterium]|nr:HEPN domain-containing protein [Chloroflexota bacterium]